MSDSSRLDPQRLVRRAAGLPGELLAALLPAGCVECDAPADAGPWAPLLCRDCAATLPLWDRPVPVPVALATAHAWALFDGPARRLVIELKFGGSLRAGRAVGRQMARAPGAGRLLRRADLLVPVPLHWRRRWRRGHSQAHVLARGMRPRLAGRRNGAVPPLATPLRRRRATRPQVGLERANRIDNVRGAFEVRPAWRRDLAGVRIVLVDDVVTTGATAAAAARALREEGAQAVSLYVAAWAEPPDGRGGIPGAARRRTPDTIATEA